MQNTSKAKIRVASVGLGWVSVHRHLPVMLENPRYDVVGVVDPKPERTAEIAKKFGIPQQFTTRHIQEIPWLNEVDAFVIGTEPRSHHQLIKTALMKGKHVLTEKPFAMKVEEGRELVEIARQQNKVLGVVHNFQFTPPAMRLLHDMRQGTLGKITGIWAFQLSNPRRRLPYWYEELPWGLFYDESPHFFYLLRLLAPGALDLQQVRHIPNAAGKNTPREVGAWYECRTPEGIIPVSFTMNFDAPLSEWHIVVLGEEQLGVYDVFRDFYTRVPNDGLHVTWTVFRTSAMAIGSHVLQHFTAGLKHLRGKQYLGNPEVFARFAAGVLDGKELQAINADDALAILTMQHDVMNKAAASSRNARN